MARLTTSDLEILATFAMYSSARTVKASSEYVVFYKRGGHDKISYGHTFAMVPAFWLSINLPSYLQRLMTNTIGIRREDLDKIGEQRSAITPSQAGTILNAGSRLLVQPALHPESGERKRVFDDEEFTRVGAEVCEDLSEAQIILGLKEVATSELLPDKTYVFFSHSHKGQKKNRPLLRAMMEADTTLIDYELIADSKGRRLLTAFGDFAGFAGIVDTLWTFGRRLAAEGAENPFEDLPQAIEVADLGKVREILAEVGDRIAREGTPDAIPPVIICILGRGRTSEGVQELLDLLPIDETTIDELQAQFENGSRDRIHKLVLEVDEMYRIADAHSDQREVFSRMNPSERFNFYIDQPLYFESNMDAVLPYVSVLVNCIIWSGAYPRTVSSDLMARVWREGTPLKVIGDITCDPNGSIEFSRETWIDDPVFTYDPITRGHHTGLDIEGVNVMAVTNLPCEFSRDASIRFGRDLAPLLPSLVTAKLDGPLEESRLDEALVRATILWKGELTPRFAYMGGEISDRR